MEIFKTESKLYRLFLDLHGEYIQKENDLTVENIGMTNEMEDLIRRMKIGREIGSAGTLELLLFTHVAHGRII